MLVGTLRCGSGITGSGGVADVAPVVSGRFCASDALICVLSRPFGAGFGTGTVCADDSVAAPATEAVIITTKTTRALASASDPAGWDFGFLINAQS